MSEATSVAVAFLVLAAAMLFIVVFARPVG
jgi:hypothetical protein